MKTFIHSSLMSATSLFFILACAAGNPVTARPGPLDGVWQLISVTQYSMDNPKKVVKETPSEKTLCLFKGDVTFMMKGEDINKETFQASETGSPLHLSIGDQKGIYERNGDTLKICTGKPDGDRPADFTSGDCAELIRMKLASKEEKKLFALCEAKGKNYAEAAEKERTKARREYEKSDVDTALENLPKIMVPALEPGRDNAALLKHLERLTTAADKTEEARQIAALVAWVTKNNLRNRVVIALGHRCPPLQDGELLTLSAYHPVKLLIRGKCGDNETAFVSALITFKDAQNLVRLIPMAVPSVTATNLKTWMAFENTKPERQQLFLDYLKQITQEGGSQPTVSQALAALPSLDTPPSKETWTAEEQEEARKVESLVSWLKPRRGGAYPSLKGCETLTDEAALVLSSWQSNLHIRVEYTHETEVVLLHEEFTLKYPRNVLRLIPLAIKTENGFPLPEPSVKRAPPPQHNNTKGAEHIPSDIEFAE